MIPHFAFCGILIRCFDEFVNGGTVFNEETAHLAVVSIFLHIQARKPSKDNVGGWLIEWVDGMLMEY